MQYGPSDLDRVARVRTGWVDPPAMAISAGQHDGAAIGARLEMAEARYNGDARLPSLRVLLWDIALLVFLMHN